MLCTLTVSRDRVWIKKKKKKKKYLLNARDREETLCSLALKSSTGSLFDNKAVPCQLRAQEVCES